MRALVYLGPRRMEPQEVPDPVPGPGEVVVATAAAAVCGSDLHGFREASPRRVPPLVMGHEAVGMIDEVGQGVDPSLTGRRVVLKPMLPCGSCEACLAGRTNICPSAQLVGRDRPGAFAERFTVPAAATAPLADAVPDDLGTLVEPLANAVHVTSRSVRPGDDVLVMGAGPIGVLMARMALEREAARVFSADQVEARLRFAQAQGAISLAVEDPEGSLRDATDGRGVDVVVDAVGVEATWALAPRAVRPGGRVEAVGLGAPQGRVDYFAVVGKEISITGSFAWTDQDFVQAIELIEAGTIAPAGWFTRSPLGEGQRAFEELVDTADLFKVVLTP